jgi:putative RecB family exonuclease
MTIYSYSRVNTYFTCPAQFEFRYIHKTPSPTPDGVELFLGSRFHECMEYLYQQIPQRVPTVNELLDYFKNHWNVKWQEALKKQKDRGFSTPIRIVQESQTIEDYYEKGQLYLENYYHKYQPFDQNRTEGIELKVLFDLDSDKQYKMQGFIDRLGRDNDGTLWIHDYKTSSRKLSDEDAKFEDQLALYQIGLAQNPKYGSQVKVKLAWHFVAFEKDLVISERNAKEIEWLKKKYVLKIQEIEKAKIFPPKPSRLCEWCEYLSLCDAGKTSVQERRKKLGKSEYVFSESSILNVSISETSNPVFSPASEKSTLSSPGVFGNSANSLGRKKRSLIVSSDQLPLF